MVDEFSSQHSKISETPAGAAVYDIIIIGGGVNGTGIARDAALRGLSVCLIEQGDLASGTSSASTKLIHGGLRYLEFYDFKLVRAALVERARLLKLMSGFIRPLEFILPYKKSMRAKWLIRLGLFLYDHLGPRAGLPAAKAIKLKGTEFGAPLKEALAEGFDYADCWVDDARLVVFNALEAKAEGAEITLRQRVSRVERLGREGFELTLETGRRIRGRALVNATGPAVNQVIEEVMGGHALLPLRLVRGSHIITPRLFTHERAYILQQDDGRIVFAIPYEDSFTLIGTTEAPHEGSLRQVEPAEAEIDYLIAAVNRDFKRQIKRRDVLSAFAGVRPLFADEGGESRSLSREYHLALEAAGGAPLLHVYGGKITTFRKLAEEAVDLLASHFPHAGPGRTAELAYTAFEPEEVAVWRAKLDAQLDFLPQSLRARYLDSYGCRVGWFLRDVTSFEALGQYFGGGLYEREVRYLIAHEWAATAEDILYRRTKCGLHMSDEERAALTAWLDEAGLGTGALGAEPLTE